MGEDLEGEKTREAGRPVILKLASRAITGTRWEGPAKRVYSTLTGNKNTLYDWQTIAVMRRVLSPTSNAIDVGAFEGGMLRHLCRLAPRGRHLAFEPNAENARTLAGAFPGVQVFPVALGDTPGEVAFHRALDHPALSGLQRRTEYLRSERFEEARVRMETLDRAAPADLPIAFVKIDVEGAELGVLRGGIQTLRRSRPVIVFESGVGGADCFGTRPEAIYDLLGDSIGLRVSLMGSWLADGPPLTRGEFTEQFVRRLNFYFVAHA
jgi:FkbM family methyltransferase